jgi:hypothetical protein
MSPESTVHRFGPKVCVFEAAPSQSVHNASSSTSYKEPFTIIQTIQYIFEVEGGKWGLKSGLFGFLHLNNAHNGVHLGQALYKVVSRLRIGHKVSVTRACDDSDTDWIRLEVFDVKDHRI